MNAFKSTSLLFMIVLSLLSISVDAAEPDVQKDAPIPANASDSVKYIGSDQCIECHKNQHESYLRTLHSKAAQFTDVALEPEPGSFKHERSGHRYVVEVIKGKMFHREQRQNEKGEPLGETEHEMLVTLGSGTHSKSYLARIGEFYVESPITYFSDDESWSMSPGYDLPAHQSFRREVGVACIFCHVGSIEQFEHNPYKFAIIEPTIGCERCHGPGELHAKRHHDNSAGSRDPSLSGHDDTIVNPSALSRELCEAICQQCHCQGVKEIEISGKDVWDFRPALRLTDYRVDFQLRAAESDAMSLVGHVEQLHRSKCYTETETLTCITCHDPHDPPREGKLVEYHREKCFQCHNDQSCGKDHSERLATNGNDCAKCHMPRRDTNVAHFALHNHRIGLHAASGHRSDEITSDVEPILDISYLPTLEQQRLKGLVKYELYRQRGGDPKFANLLIGATSELIRVKQSGKADADVDAALVWLAWEQGQTQIAESIASEILAAEKQAEARIAASHVLARLHLDRGEYVKAISLYQSLERLHRDPSDSYFLGLAEQNNGNSENAIQALKRSLEIDPAQLSARHALQAIYQSIGRVREAEEQRAAAAEYQRLQELNAEAGETARGSNAR